MKAKRQLQPGSLKTEKKTKDLPTNNFNLTIKEISVLTSLAQGKSYKMIAEDCGVTINTVREHIRKIYRKLKVHSMTEAIMIAMKHELLNFFIIVCALS